METLRLTVNDSFKVGNNLEFFVVTESLRDPIVCLGDNNGFPFVRDFYARAMTHPHGHKGVHISIRFEGEANGHEFAFNIAQPDMIGNYSILSLSN